MVRIITDSAADFEPAELEKLNISCIPLSVLLDGKSYRENLDLGKKEFYELLASTGATPQTSQPAPNLLFELFRIAGDRNDGSVHDEAHGFSGLKVQRMPHGKVDGTIIICTDGNHFVGTGGIAVDQGDHILPKIGVAGFPNKRTEVFRHQFEHFSTGKETEVFNYFEGTFSGAFALFHAFGKMSLESGIVHAAFADEKINEG